MQHIHKLGYIGTNCARLLKNNNKYRTRAQKNSINVSDWSAQSPDAIPTIRNKLMVADNRLLMGEGR